MKLHEISKSGSIREVIDYFNINNTLGDCSDIENALSMFVIRGDVESVLFLVAHGATPNCRPSHHMPPLHCAVEQRNSKMVDILCEHGASVNYANEEGYTPLHLAVDVEADAAWQRGENPKCEIIASLISYGADTNIRDLTGQTPVDIALQYDFYDAVELLKSASGDH